MWKLLPAIGLLVTMGIGASGNENTAISDLAAGNETCKSYFQPIGYFESGTYLYNALVHQAMGVANKCTCAWSTVLRVVPFGGALTDTGRRLMGEYFGIQHKRKLVAGESDNNPILSGTLAVGDFDVTHFNIVTNNGAFQSTIEFNPQRTVFGVGLDWKQGFIFHEDNSVRYWFELNGPVLHVKSKMHLTESITNNGGGALAKTGLDGAPIVGTMTDAFKQSNWKYGKIDDSHKMEKTGLADLEFKVGYNGVLTDCCTCAPYLGVIFPTGNKPRGEYVFEPVVGNGKHYGISWGLNLAYTLWCGDESTFGLRVDGDSRYLFKEEMYRSFELLGFGKAWSRYMAMYKNLAEAQAAQAGSTAASAYSGTSGINLMTRDVEVTPGLQVNINTAIIYEGCNVVAEGGWTFYSRHAEKIKPNWATGPVLKSRYGYGYLTKARTIRDPAIWIDTEPNTATVSVSAHAAPGWTGPQTLTPPNPPGSEQQQFAVPPALTGVPTVVPGDTLQVVTSNNPALPQYIEHSGDYAPTQAAYEALVFLVNDIDWNSGAQPGVSANTIYGTIGYTRRDCCYPVIFSVGGAYDFTSGSAAADRWTVFGQLGVSF